MAQAVSFFMSFQYLKQSPMGPTGIIVTKTIRIHTRSDSISISGDQCASNRSHEDRDTPLAATKDCLDHRVSLDRDWCQRPFATDDGPGGRHRTISS